MLKESLTNNQKQQSRNVKFVRTNSLINLMFLDVTLSCGRKGRRIGWEKNAKAGKTNNPLFLLLCIGQIEASTCPPPPGIPRAFDTFAVPGRRKFDYQSLPGGGEFDPHALGVGNLN